MKPLSRKRLRHRYRQTWRQFRIKPPSREIQDFFDSVTRAICIGYGIGRNYKP